MMTKKYNTSILLLMVFTLVVAVMLSGFSEVKTASADNSIQINTSLNNSDVLYDLTQCGIDGIGFDINNYPADAKGSIRLVYAVEFGYTQRENLQNAYGLYLYIYNPAELNILAADAVHTVTMDVGDGKGYSSYRLKFISRSTGDCANRFYKFKVLDNSETDRIVERVTPETRTYSFGEFEYIVEGESNVRSAALGIRVSYTGFGAALGESNESTLSCEYDTQKTIVLDVKSLSYKAGFSGGDENFQANTDIHSVYFALENEVLREYGDLVQIKFDYYQYMTPYIAVIDDYELYTAMKKYSGLVVPASTVLGQEDPQALRWELYNNAASYGLAQLSVETVAGHNRMWFYILNTANVLDETRALLCPFVYYAPNGSVSAETLLSDLENYNKTSIRGSYEIAGKTYSADILGDFPAGSALRWDISLDVGYSGEKVVTVDDEFDLATYDYHWRSKTESWWWDLFYGVPATDNTPEGITPIEVLSSASLSSSTAAKDMMINVNDLAQVRNDVATAEKNDQTVYIFRYTYTPYVTIEFPGFLGSDPGGFAASQGVVLDFDIIELGFEKNGVMTILPVAMTPLDTTSDVTPPAEDDVFEEKISDWADGIADAINRFFDDAREWMDENWKWVATGVGVVLGIVLIALIIRLIFPPKRKSSSKNTSTPKQKTTQKRRAK